MQYLYHSLALVKHFKIRIGSLNSIDSKTFAATGILHVQQLVQYRNFQIQFYDFYLNGRIFLKKLLYLQHQYGVKKRLY